MKDYIAYADELLVLGQGYALLHADPGEQCDQIRPGDVGYIYSAIGRFVRIFNIFYSQTHEVNKDGVPEGFVPLLLNMDREIVKAKILEPGVYKSESVSATGVKLNAEG